MSLNSGTVATDPELDTLTRVVALRGCRKGRSFW